MIYEERRTIVEPDGLDDYLSALPRSTLAVGTLIRW